ncbi:hypothetical protein AGR1_11935 [Agrobacterium sp. B1(2019)]|nr:hypothetical protein AGR1_11935 [Agrobacterium sp. B1(2019)]
MQRFWGKDVHKNKNLKRVAPVRSNASRFITFHCRFPPEKKDTSWVTSRSSAHFCWALSRV